MKLKVEEHIANHDNGSVWTHTFFLTGNGKEVPHGEFKVYHDNGKLAKHCFLLNGRHHGEYTEFYTDGSIENQMFAIYKDMNVPSVKMKIPFLPTKPARKEYKSNRTRYQTLEI